MEYNGNSFLNCPGLTRTDTPDSASVRCDDAKFGVFARIKPEQLRYDKLLYSLLRGFLRFVLYCFLKDN
jgi:hypothetical protein